MSSKHNPPDRGATGVADHDQALAPLPYTTARSQGVDYADANRDRHDEEQRSGLPVEAQRRVLTHLYDVIRTEALADDVTATVVIRAVRDFAAFFERSAATGGK